MFRERSCRGKRPQCVAQSENPRLSIRWRTFQEELGQLQGRQRCFDRLGLLHLGQEEAVESLSGAVGIAGDPRESCTEQAHAELALGHLVHNRLEPSQGLLQLRTMAEIGAGQGEAAEGRKKEICLSLREERAGLTEGQNCRIVLVFIEEEPTFREKRECQLMVFSCACGEYLGAAEQGEGLVDPALVRSQQAQEPGKPDAGAQGERLVDELAGSFLEELVRDA